MVLTVSFALSPVTGLVCHRRLRGVKGPSGHFIAFRKLDASVGASGPHDFAVRRKPPSSKAPPASTASRRAFVTIASRPSVRRDGGFLVLILATAKAEYFSRQGWTLIDPAGVLICPTGICVRRPAVQRAP
jgi:hypothetical protein